MKECKVLKPIPYGGKMRKSGERITATNKHAALLSLAGKVKIIKIEERKKEEYPTRHMSVEQPGSGRNALRPQESGRQGGENRRERRRRQYARSDMTPQS